MYCNCKESTAHFLLSVVLRSGLVLGVDRAVHWIYNDPKLSCMVFYMYRIIAILALYVSELP